MEMSTIAAASARQRKFFRLLVLASLFSACASIPVPTVKPFADNRAWVLLEDLVYSVGRTGIRVEVPAGFVTDFASIPKPLWWWLSPHDYYSKAAIVHDYLYWTQRCTREQADNLLLLAMEESGVSPIKREAVYLGVRAGGWAAWDNNSKERAEGRPRVLSRAQRQFPNMATWDEYRRTLVHTPGAEQGAADGTAPAYCALGNQTKVPQ